MSMKMPSKKVITELADKFPGFSYEILAHSPNSLPIIFTKGDEKYFVKLVDKSMAEQEGLEGMEERLIDLDSPYLVKLLEAGDLSGVYSYLKFECIDGFTLDDIKRDLTTEELTKIASDLSQAIAVLWDAGLVHRDIKPKNIMFNESTGNYMLVDLGIGYFSETPFRDNSKSKSNGSRFYSSPEQFESNQDDRVEITFASDVFSLGVVLFERATGVHPYKDFDEKKYNNYGAAVSQLPPQKTSDYKDDIDPALADIIDRMVQTQAIDRYISTRQLIAATTGTETPEPNRDIKMYIQDTEDGVGYKRLTNYIASSDTAHRLDGVLVTTSNGSLNRIKDLKALGFEVIVDPMTTRLPYRDAKTTSIKGQLKLNPKKVYSVSQLPSTIDSIIQGTINWQEDASSIVLPYFAVRNADDDFLDINKDIWRRGKSLLTPEQQAEGKKVYGGIALPVDIVSDPKIRKSVLNHFLAKYNVDGIFVVFENNKKPIKTLDDKDLLEGIKEVLDTLYEMGDVIVARSDMSFLPLMRGGTFVTSFSDSRRRFSFKDQLDSPSPGGGGAIDRKLKYYVDPIYTFVEEKNNMVALGRVTELVDELNCDCPHCGKLKPFESGQSVDHQLAENHFYHKITDIRNELNARNPIDKNTYLREKITEAIRISDLVKAKTYLTSEQISNHVGLLGLINY